MYLVNLQADRSILSQEGIYEKKQKHKNLTNSLNRLDSATNRKKYYNILSSNEQEFITKKRVEQYSLK